MKMEGRKLSKSASGLRVIPVSDAYASPFALAEPAWVPDNEVTTCCSCNKPFGFFNRKHHCRRCGQCFCDQCCHHVISLKRMYFVDPVRHCYDCAVTSKAEEEFYNKTMKLLVAGSDFAVHDKSDELIGQYKCHLTTDHRYIQFHEFKVANTSSELKPPRVPLVKITEVKFATCEVEDEKIPCGFTVKFKDEEDSAIIHELKFSSIDKKASVHWLACIQKAFKLLYETREK
ncbi:zinc finger FYVE domain-containing protein 21-like [Clavelina lepadiformis]|uniref:FYVE-type domain-containing protein n=1 Tax=Clavelina lepadiformis TaxID=159417 RepID=A0ABP0GL35_CLALP